MVGWGWVVGGGVRAWRSEFVCSMFVRCLFDVAFDGRCETAPPINQPLRPTPFPLPLAAVSPALPVNQPLRPPPPPPPSAPHNHYPQVAEGEGTKIRDRGAPAPPQDRSRTPKGAQKDRLGTRVSRETADQPASQKQSFYTPRPLSPPTPATHHPTIL